jgi:hypothetical protein
MSGESQLYAGQKPVHPDRLHYDYMTNGVTKDAVGDYRSAVERFKITCASGSQRLHLHRMIIYVEDVGNFKSAKYGVDLDLSEGIHVRVHAANDSIHADLTAADPIITNAQWGALCYDVTLDTYGTGNNGSLAVRWTFDRAGAPVTLSSGEYLAVDLNDDFTALEKHTFMVQGYYA